MINGETYTEEGREINKPTLAELKEIIIRS